jgi:CRP-like cAMP-binding protein
VLSHATVRSCDAGETLFLQGDKARHVHIVLDGWVKLYRIAPNGNEAVVSVFSKSQSFGEAVALRNGVYPVSSEAATDCRIARIPATDLVDQMRREPDLSLALVASTFQHLHELVGQVEHLKSQSGAQRVAEFLVDLCPQTEGPCQVRLPYDKALIAGRLGMKPESLSRVFIKLRQVGVRIERSHADIADVERLSDYCSGDGDGAWRSAG